MLKTLLPEMKKNKPNLLLYISYSDDVDALNQVVSALAEQNLDPVSIEDVSGGWRLLIADRGAETKALTASFREMSEKLDIDIAFVDAKPEPSLEAPGILFMDMDSTLIQCECIDEIADFLGIKDKISAITQSTMEGHLDFSESLVARVQLLAGLDEAVLQQVFEERIRLTEGAEKLIETVHLAGWKVGLVSGGFTYFTNLLKERLNLDFVAANTLEIVGGKLTGKVVGGIIDGQAKKDLLIQQSAAWGIDLKHTVALGDGANDLPMLETACVGIAFHAKPKVRLLAPYALSKGGLDQTLHLLTPLKDGA